MKLKRLGVSLYIGLIVLLIGVQSKSVNAAQENMDFEVQMVDAKDQVNRDNRFFDLGLEEGQHEEIQMKVRNFSNRTIKVHSQIDNSITQIGGGIIYRSTKNSIIRDKQHTLMDVAKVNPDNRVISIEPHKTQIVSASIKMPEDTTKGMIYGSWNFIEYGKKSSESNSSISGNYAYNIGIVLRGQRYKVYPELKYQSVEPIVQNRHAALGIQLNNERPMAIKNAQVKAVIYKKGIFSNKRVYEASNVDVAPNSQFTVPISWGYDQMKPGNYTVSVIVKGKSYWNQLPMTWHFNEKITVDAEQASKVNQEAIKRPTNSWAWITVACGVLMLISFWFVYQAFKLTRGGLS